MQESVRRSGLSDTPAVEDEIGFEPYVDAIAAFLVNERTRAPLTLSVEGEWGSGKSSFMGQLEQVLQSKYGKRTVKFNAWKHDKDEALWASFALEFIRQSGPPGLLARGSRWLALSWRRWRFPSGLPVLVQFVAALLLLGLVVFSLVRWAFSPAPEPEWLRWFTETSAAAQTAVIGLVTFLSGIMGTKALAGLVGNPFNMDLRKHLQDPDYRGRRRFLDAFQEDFKSVIDTYVGSSVDKVFVFIDDLDRCEVSKAADLMHALHLMIPENSKLIFILGMDRNIVAASIAQRQSAILPLLVKAVPGGSPDPDAARQSLAFGHSFLDRFIQIPFRVPRMNGRSLLSFCDSLMLEPALLTEKKKERAWQSASGFDWSFQWGAPQRRAIMMIEAADADSPALRKIVAMFAPVLDSNPRRLKQFINVFRLNAFIFSELGHFDVTEGQEPSTQLNLIKMAKLVALELWWPRLLDAAERDATLLLALEQKLATGKGNPDLGDSQPVRDWIAQSAPMRVLALALEAGEGIGALEIARYRSVAPAAKRTGIASDWRRRSTAPTPPPSSFMLKRFLQASASSHEAEAKTNLKAIFTGEKAFFGEKDRYSTSFQALGFQPVQRSDGTQLPVPSPEWAAGGRFIYSVELRGAEFQAYALGMDGKVKDVEYEIRSDGDWAGSPRKIAAAIVGSAVHETFRVAHQDLSVRLKLPSLFSEAFHHRRGEPASEMPSLARYPRMLSLQGAPQGSIGIIQASSRTGPEPVFEYLFLAKDKSAHFVVRAYEGSAWMQRREDVAHPSKESGKQVLSRHESSKAVQASGFCSGHAFTQAAIIQNKVIVELELHCDVQAKTGYAKVLPKILTSIRTARKGHFSEVLFELAS
ncbi:hypothetical protein COCOR_02509 [Corallococcus coralloides DSM 2259]|uniref:KAP NTPase domain-containing protein n=1 Tax=Corallococcus coralloides (strain ATCC 25202 / DSM 2259 / NBRC 100086 / M2) TaxID=1144275 RepID=H8MQV9_CORCM|nr:hypothetical protein COCOR_02509 [Corallococcus coralloides DSM 2259]